MYETPQASFLLSYRSCAKNKNLVLWGFTALNSERAVSGWVRSISGSEGKTSLSGMKSKPVRPARNSKVILYLSSLTFNLKNFKLSSLLNIFWNDKYLAARNS